MQFRLLFLFLMTATSQVFAQNWQGQIGTNLATLPGRSLEITSAWSPRLDRWAITVNAGYTHQNSFGGFRSGFACDCGVDDLKTSGAFVKVGYKRDLIRSNDRLTKLGLPIGLSLIGSQYRQEGTIESFGTGESVYRPHSADGFLGGLGITAALNIRFSSRWNLDLGVQKFVGFQKRTDYFLFDSYISHQPGVGLTDWKNFWPGLQGIVGLNYRLGRR
ncbi:hypothetical protein ACFPMF_02330 [Larkinella bovis]|uniref:DUF3575 domain-containing protein n=1 Tax=Larkinella bovis TaxID=683041 RepID=A0ABW0I3N1_9BACT